MFRNISEICISADYTIKGAMSCINGSRCSIALVVDTERRLLGTITDGDVRRAVLAGIDLEKQVSVLLTSKINSKYPKPITATIGTGRDELLALMHEHFLRHIPILDNHGKVVDMVMLDDLVSSQYMPLQAVIMAGGIGARLRPLTEDLPKPMLHVGGKPLMELVIEQLRQAGIRRINVTTHFKPEKIREHFGDGKDFGVEFYYFNEEQPLGTGGSLGLIDAPAEPILVINGDILTQVDFKAMLAFHREHKADMTMAVRQYSMQVPYGVVECEGPRVCSLSEKPKMPFLVNAGIYILEPTVNSSAMANILT